MTEFTLTIGPSVTVNRPDGAVVLSPLKSVTVDTEAAAVPSGSATLDPTSGVLALKFGLPTGLGIKSLAVDQAGTSVIATMTDGSTQEISLAAFKLDDKLSADSVYTDQNGALRLVPSEVGVLPSDVTVNGGVYQAGATPLPAGLSLNSDNLTIMTDGSVYYPGTVDNDGVLCSAEA